MKHFALILLMVSSLSFYTTKAFAQLHNTPECGNNFVLKWSTYPQTTNEYGWTAGSLSNTFTNVDNSDVDISIAFTGETSTLGFWAGQTPKIGTQSSYLYKGIDLLTNGFTNEGITCTVTFSKPIYALSFDIHHVNMYNENGDKYLITAKNTLGNTIYPNFTNSPSPSYTTDNTTGTVNAVSNLTSEENPIVGVNFLDDNFITSITILWEDCEACEPNKPHATGIGDFSFCTPQTLDFDGEDDYISTPSFLGGRNEVTMMSWIKIDENFAGGDIMGQPNFKLSIDENNRLTGFLKTNTGLSIVTPNTDESKIKKEIWQHIAFLYNGKIGVCELYLNGNKIWSFNDDSISNTTIINTSEWNDNYSFQIGRNAQYKNNYYKGSINEVRVFNKALNLEQIYAQINQQIENDNGTIKGALIPKTISDLLWEDVLLYYKMDINNTGHTPDSSKYNRDGVLHNMIANTYQETTAPLPYITNTTNGNWNNPTSWKYGNIWDIPSTNSDYAIVDVQGNLEVEQSTNIVGLIINEGKALTVKNSSALVNTYYLKLDGKLKLEGDSQLIQTKNSTLDAHSTGVLEKDVTGTADKYTYDYWSSPVSTQNNISNNNNYTVNDVFADIAFLTSGYDGSEIPLGIADYWIWKFSNKLSDNYASWQHIRSTGEISPGEGFTMKGPGTGNINDKQNYVLKGKPNNGEINLTVNAGNDYLLGNPYPSAIDAVQFLLDNKSGTDGLGVTNGTLYFWKHWGGGSHVASDYQGGYATFSLSGGLPAATQGNDNIDIFPNENSIEIPNRYIPAGQGFYITSETDGIINFNNGQRIFHLDSSTKSTQISKNNTYDKSKIVTDQDTRMKLRIGFNSVNALKRQLLITVDENATSGIDWGYDSKYIDTQIDDMYWMLNNEKYLIQAVETINETTTIPLGLHTDKTGLNSICIDEIENPTQNLKIYLHDKELNRYHDLKQSKYEAYLEAGEYTDRFEITFSKPQTLSNKNQRSINDLDVFFSNEKHSIIIKNESLQTVKSVELFNILGQSLFKLQTNSSKQTIAYKVPRNITGNYIIKLETELGEIAKKVSIQ
ncbi:Por secretion system C-terminal sorting domain-containing protein [Hyunsoonleella jejuensis]|uniref:Por secretion system C-terminal sorting domain-containing protein n=1 Tax=Hyunsoonleella jejuensis TaxID=419940 RepID=A0A1H9JQ90_9FLAO|nr:LamG-like jellyroll fold domain-containing protein [Hyunsoonleella jejuensis]SEQ88933.1 Por secretion system C-terminal sorting domain-containing protein [Hyunsoonleella jejuensis]